MLPIGNGSNLSRTIGHKWQRVKMQRPFVVSAGTELPISRIAQVAGIRCLVTESRSGLRWGLVRRPIRFYTRGFDFSVRTAQVWNVMRFTLVDRILALTPGKSITTIKNLSLAEEYLADHFPGFPVLPGVLMVEAMIQSSAWLMKSTEDFAYSTVLLRQAKAVKFNSFVTPGKTLQVQIEVVSQNGAEWTVKGSGTVDGQSAVSARLVMQRMNLREKNPDLVHADEIAVQSARDLFRQLWTPPATASV